MANLASAIGNNGASSSSNPFAGRRTSVAIGNNGASSSSNPYAGRRTSVFGQDSDIFYDELMEDVLRVHPAPERRPDVFPIDRSQNQFRGEKRRRAGDEGRCGLAPLQPRLELC